jgi:hypothetical protein
MKEVTAVAVPSWFAEFKAPVIQMGGGSIRPLITKITLHTVTVRYPGKLGYQDPIILQRLLNLCKKYRVAMVWKSSLRGLMLTFGDSSVVEEGAKGESSSQGTPVGK